MEKEQYITDYLIGIDPSTGEAEPCVMVVCKKEIWRKPAYDEGYDYGLVNVADTEKFDYDNLQSLIAVQDSMNDKDCIDYYDIFEAPPLIIPTDKESGVNEKPIPNAPKTLSEKEKAEQAYKRAMKVVD